MSDSEPSEGNKYFGWMSKGYVWIALLVFALVTVFCFGVASSEAASAAEAFLVPLGFIAAFGVIVLIVALCVGGKPYQPVKATQDKDPKYQRLLDERRRRT